MASKAAADKYGFDLLIYVSQDATITRGAEIIKKKSLEIFGNERFDSVTLLKGASLLEIAQHLKLYAQNSFTWALKGAKNRPGGRVYILAHGDWNYKKLGNYDADDFALILRMVVDFARQGSGIDLKIKLVSVLGCLSANKSDVMAYAFAHWGHSLNSFAGLFHARIRGICDLVYARSYLVGHNDDGSKYTRDYDWAEGIDTTNNQIVTGPVARQDSAMHHRPQSKLVYSWSGDKQVCEYYDYAKHSTKEEIVD